MRVLQVSAVYGRGSVGKIVSDIHHFLLKQGFESFVAYGATSPVPSEDKERVFKTCSEFDRGINHLRYLLTGMDMNGCFKSTRFILKKIKELKPDIVHIHCFNDFYLNPKMLFKFLGKRGIKTVFTLHCEHSYTGSCGYCLDCDKWKRKGCDGHCHFFHENRKIFPLFDRTKIMWKRMNKAFSFFKDDDVAFCSCTPWLDCRLSESLILSRFSHHGVVLNGANSDIYHYYNNCDYSKIRKVLYVVPRFDDPMKGATQINDIASRFLSNRNVVFELVGSVPDTFCLSPNIVRRGFLKGSELAEAYSSASVSIMLSKAECFPMVCVESLLCGTKIVAFKCGGPDKAFSKEFVSFVEQGDYDDFEKSINSFLDSKYDKLNLSENANSLYSKEIMAENYLSWYLLFETQ